MKKVQELMNVGITFDELRPKTQKPVAQNPPIGSQSGRRSRSNEKPKRPTRVQQNYYEYQQIIKQSKRQKVNQERDKKWCDKFLECKSYGEIALDANEKESVVKMAIKRATPKRFKNPFEWRKHHQRSKAK